MAADYWDLNDPADAAFGVGRAIPLYGHDVPSTVARRPWYGSASCYPGGSVMVHRPVVYREREVAPAPPPEPEGPKLVLPDRVRDEIAAERRRIADEHRMEYLTAVNRRRGPTTRPLNDDESIDRYGETIAQMGETITFLEGRVAEFGRRFSVPRPRRRRLLREAYDMLTHARQRRDEARDTRVDTETGEAAPPPQHAMSQTGFGGGATMIL